MRKKIKLYPAQFELFPPRAFFMSLPTGNSHENGQSDLESRHHDN